MKAIVYHTYGSPDVLNLEEVQKPNPQDDEVLVKVVAASVNAADLASAARRSIPGALRARAVEAQKHNPWC